MIKHIVMWKLKETELTTKKMVMEKIKTELEALNGQIEGLIRLEVGIDFLQSESSYDIVLYSELENKEALDYYQSHPLHCAVANEYVKPAVSLRKAVDYEI